MTALDPQNDDFIRHLKWLLSRATKWNLSFSKSYNLETIKSRLVPQDEIFSHKMTEFYSWNDIFRPLDLQNDIVKRKKL